MTITGSIEQASSNAYLYSDSLNGDILFRSMFSNNFLFGFNSNVPSTFAIKQSLGAFAYGNSNTPAYLNLCRARMSNTSLQSNDIIGSVNFVARYGNTSSSNVATISSIYTGTGTTKSGSILFNTECNLGITERMRLTDAGNLGIGTTVPSGILHARTAYKTPRQLSIYDSNNINKWYDYSTLYSKYTSNTWYFETSNNIICSAAFNTLSNSQSINTTLRYNSNGSWIPIPSDGSILPFFTQATQGGVIQLTELEDSGPFTITNKTNTTTVLTATAGGFVGVGTSNPTYKLDVNGNLRAGMSILGNGNTSLNGASTTSGIILTSSTHGSMAGPHTSVYVNNSTYPTFQQLIWGSDNISFNFDCYYENIWKHATSSNTSFQIYKMDNKLSFNYATSSGIGSNISWTNGFTMDSAGKIGLGGVQAPSYTLDVNGTSHVSGNAYFDGSVFKPGGGSFAASSDERLKTNILSLSNALDKLCQLQGKSFSWKYPEYHGLSEINNKCVGFIAQEVQQVFPDWVKDIYIQNERETNVLGGNSTKVLELPVEFNAYVVESIKELVNENNALKGRVQILENQISSILQKIA